MGGSTSVSNILTRKGTLVRNEQTGSALSLSVYCRPVDLARPKTAQIDITKGIPGLEPVQADENGVVIEAKIDTRIADMKPIEGLELIARTGTA